MVGAGNLPSRIIDASVPHNASISSSSSAISGTNPVDSSLGPIFPPRIELPLATSTLPVTTPVVSQRQVLKTNSNIIMAAVSSTPSGQMQSNEASMNSRWPVKKSAFIMSLSMALHFFGYEFSRSSILSLFTSKTVGFGDSSWAFPLAMSCVSPLSFLMLLGYGRELGLRGPRAALRNSGLFCAVFLCLSGVGVSLLGAGAEGLLSSSSVSVPIFGDMTPSKALIWASFVFQNSYAHLLYTQQWSFIGSVLTAEEGATLFSAIAGLSSLSSTAAGAILSITVDKMGLAGLLGVAGTTLVVSMILADAAYGISEIYNFDPAEDMKIKKKEKDESGTSNTPKEMGLIAKTRDMFLRVPVLGALFNEVVSFQSFATLLNIWMVTMLKDVISDDAERAAWTGKFYSYVNGVSGTFQFVLLPIFLKRVDVKVIWRILPFIPLCCILSTQVQPSLNLVAFSFFAAKVMDYSIRNVLNEMIYVPLDFDSRYLGKEVIGVFGNRFGKSGISLLLSGMGYAFGSFGTRELSRLTAVASLTWFSFAFRLSSYIPKKDEVAAGSTKKEK